MNAFMMLSLLFISFLMAGGSSAFNQRIENTINPATSRTITVPDDYPTIQSAINAASDGDTVFVRNGTYYENVVVDKAVSLVGESADTTVINGPDTGGWVMSVTADNVSVSGFTLMSQYPSRNVGLRIYAENCEVSNCIITDNWGGILLWGSSAVMSENTVEGNPYYGIDVNSSPNNTITGNTVESGIRLDNSSFNNLIENDCDGIALVFSSNNNTLIGNNLVGGNLYVYQSWGTEATNNLVNGGPLVYAEDQSGQLIRSAREVILINCQDMLVTKLENASIELEGTTDTQITSNDASPIEVFDSSNNNSITENKNCDIYIDSSSNNAVTYNQISVNSAITLANSRDNNVNRNNLTASNGIILTSYCDNNTISQNEVTSSGIDLSYFCDNNIIAGNNISDNDVGVYLSYSSNGNSIRYNSINDNLRSGITIGYRVPESNPEWGGCSSNFILGNNITGNANGIQLIYSNATIFHNNFEQNAAQADTYYSSAQWDNGYPSGGNCWSDYNGTDLFSGPYQNISGSDGIGDTPYIIGAKNTDNYPLMTEFPLSSELVAPVADFTYSPSTPNVNETVTFDASISQNGWNGTQSSAISTYAWDFGDNNTATGTLQVLTHAYAHSGNYTVTLGVADAQGLWNITEKQVQVYPPHSPLAAFTTNPEFTYVGQDIQLNASVSLSGWNGSQENPITSYIWDFGDGNVTSSADSTIVHGYAYAGSFNVTLTISDSENMSSSCSHTVLVIMPTSVSVGTSAASTLLGYVVNMNGTLSDIHGNPIGNEPVILSYTFPGAATWFQITSGLTDSFGDYSAEWIPTATGTFQVKAEWVGNATLAGSESNVTLSCIPALDQYVFSVESNSTISALAFNTTSQELSFTASGPSGTTGYAKVTIAKSLVSNITNIRVYLDNNQTEYSITSTDDSWLLMFNYTHSTHTVRVDLSTSAIPEFSNDLILFLLVTLAVAVLVAEKRKFAKRAR